jgi:hypothetical protein
MAETSWFLLAAPGAVSGSKSPLSGLLKPPQWFRNNDEITSGGRKNHFITAKSSLGYDDSSIFFLCRFCVKAASRKKISANQSYRLPDA